jgi:hypothetical protein
VIHHVFFCASPINPLPAPESNTRNSENLLPDCLTADSTIVANLTGDVHFNRKTLVQTGLVLGIFRHSCEIQFYVGWLIPADRHKLHADPIRMIQISVTVSCVFST